MRKLVFWVVGMMAFMVGGHEALVRLGVPPDQAFIVIAIAAAIAATFAAAIVTAIVTAIAATFAAAIVTAIVTAVTAIVTAAAALTTALFVAIAALFARDELEVPYWQVLAVVVLEAGGILVGLLVAWWWVLPAIGGELLLYNYLAPRKQAASAFHS